MKKVIAIRRVKDDYGWMGNMGKRKLVENGKTYNSSEGLFICKRFNDESIQEYLRTEDNGGMRVKMLSKSYLSDMCIEMCGVEDVNNMRDVIRLKIRTYDFMRDELIRLKSVYSDVFIYEDVGKRHKKGNNLFWGGYFDSDNNFIGENMLGKIWMEMMEEVYPKGLEFE